jgi:hypothetical protein
MAEYLESEREWAWHRRLIWPVAIAAVLCIPVVIFHWEWLAWTVWAVFVLDDVIMLSVVRRKGAWMRAHWFDNLVVFVTFPAWHDIAPDLFALELVGALRLIELINLLKLIKAARILRRTAQERRSTRRASRARSG